MNSKKIIEKTKSTGARYVFSGLLKTFSTALSGIIILRWLHPEELGQWQSFLVFVGYLQILTLGTTSGLNREIAYLIGKGKKEEGIEKLRTVGYYTTTLSLLLMLIICATGIILYLIGMFDIEYMIMFILAFSTGALTIQTNFLGATYRSSSSFNYLSKVQFYVSFLYFILLPLIYFFDLWGYIIYQVSIALALYLGYYWFRPYKVSYKFKTNIFKELVSIGLPMYIWNYLASVSRSIPRLILVTFGTPLILGLYTPAGTINTAMLSLPLYVNRYLNPKISGLYGRTEDKRKVYIYSMSAVWKLFIAMSLIALFISLTIPYIIEQFFPKYVEGTHAVQITVFSGVFFCMNNMIHNAINSLKAFKLFKIIVTLRYVNIVTFSAVGFFIFDSLLTIVSFGVLMAEIFNFLSYWRAFKKLSIN